MSQYLLHGRVKLLEKPVEGVGHYYNFNHFVVVVDRQELLPHCHIQVEYCFSLVHYFAIKYLLFQQRLFKASFFNIYMCL